MRQTEGHSSRLVRGPAPGAKAGLRGLTKFCRSVRVYMLPLMFPPMIAFVWSTQLPLVSDG